MHVGASYSPAHFQSPPPLFQGENLLYCFEVAPTQPALTQGKQVPSYSYLPQGGCLAPPPHGHPACPAVTQCRTEGSTRGLAAVPRLALDVMACEVLRVLQLTDTALVPVSYLVPRKVWGPWGWHCLIGAWCHLMGDISPAPCDKKDLAAVRPLSPAWGEEWRSNLGADGGLQSLGKPGAACRVGVLESGC